MKKTITLFMALALVTSLFAVPHNPKQFVLEKQKVQTEQKLAQRIPVAKKNIARKAVRKAAMEESTTTFTYTSVTDTLQTKGGIKVQISKAKGQSAPQWNEASSHLRIYASNTITVTADSITKVELTCTKGKDTKDYATMTASTGKLVSGGESASSTDSKTDTWTGKANNVVFTLGDGQRAISQIVVTLGGQGGGGGEGDTITITDINYGDAYYYTYEDATYWDIDLYKDMDWDTYELTYPEFYVSIAADSKTAIAGEAELFYAGLWTSENDSVEMAEGTLTISYDKTAGTYSFSGEFIDEEENVYVLSVAGIEIGAYDADNEYEIIELDEEGGGGSQYSFDFTKDQQNWTINDVELTGVTYVWKQDSQYGMKGTAYANKQANAAESWLVSPNIDLSTFTEATLKVKQAINKAASTNLRTKISTDGGSTWTDLALNLPEGTSWDFQTDQVSLDAYVGDTVKIAFAYISTTEVCPTWEIMTVDITSAAGGDTIEVKDVDGLEIDYYPSYSEVGAYDYMFLLYNSEDEDYIPMVAFDILTATEKSYAGTYTMQGGTLTEYSYYVYGTGDEDYFYITDGEITITDNGNDSYTIKGWFTDGTNVYSIDKTVDGEYFNAEYPYEPETPSTLNLTVTAGEIDDTYATSYGMIDIYLTTADGEVHLEYYLPESATTLEDGTYPIEAADYDEEGTLQQAYGFFNAGYYYSSYGMAVASTYQTEEENFYLVGGTVKVETVAEGTKITLAGTTYYGSTINAVYTIAATALQTVKAIKATDGKYLMDGKLFIQRNGVLFNAQGQMVR